MDTLYGVEELRGGWLTRFSILTDGRAIVDVASTPKEDIPTNPGITPPTVTPRALPPNIDDGVRWLMNNQRSDGSWMDLPQTKERDTAETVYVLKDFDFAQTNYSSGLLWLNGIYSGNMDYLSRKIETFVRSGQDVAALMNELLSRQNPDGGWGSNKYYLSNPTDTSFALKSLAVTGYQGQTVLAKAIEYLKLKQNADGGWGNDDEGSSIQVTANVLLSFKGYRTAYPLEEQITGGMTWLIQRQNLDGGFGNSPSTIYDTAVALLTLKELGASNEIVNPGLNYILSLQSDDGSWYRSPYQTALAVKAVWKVTIDPDLSIKTNDITITPSSITSLPLDIVITTIAQNLGRTDVAQVKVVLYDGAVSDANKVGEQVLAIPGQSSVTVTFSLTIRDGNEHLFYIVIDPDNLVKESDKTNNTAAKALHSETTYDFEILSSDISVSPNPVDMLHDVRINSKIRNKGTMNAYNVQVRYYIDEAGSPLDIATSTVNIPANSIITNEITWKANKAGQNLPITVFADPFNSFEERSETNNKAVTYLTVNALTDPNLTVSYQDIVITPTPGRERGSVNISALVKNDGFSQASNILVNFYKGVPGQDGVLLGSQTIPSLNIGESIRVSIDWTNIMESGERIIYVPVDPLNQINEIREDDNSAFTTLKILSLPDFAISTNSITFNPPAPKDGDTVAINVTVQNKGEQGAQNVTVRASEGSTVIGSQVIPSISGNSQAVATITYNTAGKSGPHQITVVVDPDNTILEQSEDNNRASRTFGVQNANLWLTEPYISPNGDGVKDSTQFFFRLNNPQTVKVAVVNEKGETVKSFSGGLLDNASGGNVTWDGKNDNGVVVADGDYQIQVLDPNNNNIGSLLVVVDNNRSPLLKAIGTKYLLNKNLTCMLPDFWNWESPYSNLTWFPDESGVLLQISAADQNTPEYPTGTYSMGPDGEDILRLIPWEWRKNLDPKYDYCIGSCGYGEHRDYDLSPDGEKVAFVLNKYNRLTYRNNYELSQLWVVDRDGRNLTLLDSYTILQNSPSLYNVTWAPDGSYIGYKHLPSTGSELWIIKPDGTGKTKVAASNTYVSNFFWSPGSNKIVYIAYADNSSRLKIWLTDIAGNIVDISRADGYYWIESLKIEWLNNEKIILVENENYSSNKLWLVDVMENGHLKVSESIEGYQEFVSEPNGKSFAFTESINDLPSMKISDEMGNTRVIHNSKSVGYYGSPLYDLRWSKDGSKLAFVDRTYEKFNEPVYNNELDECVYNSYLIVFDLKTEEKKAFKVSDAMCLCCGGSYHVQTIEGGSWIESGLLSYDSTYKTKELDLTSYLSKQTSPYQIRISQQGKDAAHIDRVALSIDGRQYAPTKALNTSTGEDILNKVIFKDNDVADAHNSTADFIWENVPMGKRISLVLNAREEDLKIRKTIPFRHPKTNYYSFRIDQSGPVNVDGQITPEDNLSQPLFKAYTRPVTGHPEGYTHGYIKTDGEHLYGVLDFTPDNTMDYGKDWASVEILTPNGTKTFLINDSQQKYGRASLTYTQAVNYQHMVYEFKIPLSEIGAKEGDTINIAFNAYGTAAGGGDNYLYYTDGSLQWHQDSISIYAEDNNGVFVINTEDQEKTYLPIIEGYSVGISPLGRYITYYQSVDPSSVCYGRGYIDLWAISSLLNLTADLRIKKEKSAIILKGSAVDLNFEGYVLEYADTKSPTVWNLVAPASNVSVIDDAFTTWVPPYEGIFYVRLTVWDKAGNVVWDRKRVSWGLSASITNLYKTLEYFSPNGDGVKDAVELRYKVLEPVHLEFNIYDENNNLKRTFLKDHANPGEDFITWDGRDENGGVVPDGKYKIKVFDYEFFVKVDNTPPDVNIVLGDLYPDDSIISVNLTGHAVDQYIEYWVIEYGEGDNPQEWYEYLRGEDILVARDDEGNPILNPVGDKLVKKFLWTDITWLVGKKLRITAEDFAGNRTTAITEFLEEEIVLNKWDMNFIWGFIPDDLAKPGQHNLAGLETIRLPVVSLNVQYMKKVGEWIDSPPIIDSPSASFNVEWDNSSLGPEEGFSVRLRAVDILGQEHYSNILGRDRFEVNSYCKAPNLIAFNILHEELKLLSFQMKESGGSAWADYWVLDSSKGDSIPTGKFYPPIPSVQPGSQYLIRMIGIGVSGKTYESIADYPPLCLQLYVVPDEADCGYMSNKAKLEAKIDVKKMPNLEGISFKALSYYIQKPEGLQLLRQFDLTIEKWGNVEIDTLNMPEGSYPVEAILSYVDSIENTNNETTGSDMVIVDRILPTARITYPGTSLRVCPIRVSDPKGNWYGIPVEGIAADNTQVMKYKLYYGIGENPSGWMEAYTRKLGAPKLISGSGPVTGKIGTWDITGLREGTYSLRLKVVDISGNATCYTTSFSFDNVVEIAGLTADKTLFSPNGDGIVDELQINYEIDEYARVDVKVFKLLKNQDGTYSLDSTPVRTIVSGQQHLGGTETTSWDGKDDAGTVVPDGLYGIAVFATDSCGNTNMRWIGLEVDNTPPTTAITYPQPSDPLGNIVEVKGTADDLHFQSYTLEVGQGDYPETWNLISSSTNPVENGIFGQWNTFGREGKWTLRLTATDTVGNKNTTSVTIDLGQRKTLIKDLAGNPRLFSPNNDGKLDTTGINYEVTDACDMTIEIIDFNSTVRKTYTTTTSSAGVYSYTWDGRDNAGALVPDGTYAVKLTAALSSNTSVTQTESVTVVVDSTPPFMDIKQPLNNSYLKADVIVNGAIGDANIREYSVAYTGDSGAGTIDQGNQNRVNYTFGFINELAEGNYTLAVKAKDLAENSVEQNIAFVIDRTPPKVSLDAPKEGEYYGSDKNTISVTGAIVEKNLDTYSVRYGSGDNPTQWTDLLTGNVVPTNPQLITWKVGKNDGIPDGLYTVSLFAKDKAGLTGEAKVKVTVDNTPPEAVITSPAEGGYVRAAIDINGTAFDQNLEKYIFEISEGQCSSAYKWVPIKTSTTSVRGGVIASWHTLPPDGDCCLRVTVSDKVGNKSEARVNVKVDTQPPAAPVLTGKVENKSSARLTWTANSEPDLSGYNLYRDAKKVNTALIKDINYLDQNLKEGTYTYTVTAIDLAGNESKPSNQIKLTVDITPPDARINSPQGSAWVSGLVDIKGTAYSADDFKEYRVSIGQGSAPSAWNLIRTSPLATSYGSLAPWDTIGLPEGIYSIKLEAEDLSGNINTHQVAVNLDNTPPRAPVLLTATATGSDVTLTWQANPEADLAGYLLYRNDQLANVSGIVIGNLKPYLIVGTTYLNKAVPDGKSRYYLIAMDQAGNLSDQSNTLEVDIDTRPPHATIAEPLDKSKIQDKTFVRAESPDTDIASVQFQYKRAQDTTWINLNNPVADSPYGTYLDPAGLGFVHGDYHLRAVATDLGSKTDPSPSFITVTYTDLASPDTPKDLRALTNGTDVTLTWTANTETDLDGYNIYRTSGDSKTKINSAVVKATTYPDNGLADASYTYEVTAIDTFSNESKPSNSASARVYAPLIQQPYTPTGQNVLEIRGSNSTATASVEVTIEPVSGSVIRVTTPSDPAGNFNINNASLALGENRITAKATDSSGNISRVSEMVVVVYNEPPSAPTGLNASVNGNDVALTWNSNTETDLSGYNLYRDGKKLNLSISIAPQEGTTSSSDMDSSPADAFDLDPETYWYSSGSGAPVWWQIDLSTPELINHMEIHWASGFDSQGNEIIYGGKEYEIQVWSGYAWITQTKVTGNNAKDNTFDFKPSYRTDKIRIYMTESADPSVEKWVSISEVGIVKDVLITQQSYADSGTNVKGEIHTFKATAVDYYGFESAPSEGATAEFGDSISPAPPQNLTATVTGSDVILTWSPNSETDLAGYNIYRNASQGWLKINAVLVNGAAYIDANLPSGTYTYRVTAVDAVGNESLPSNEATATVQDFIAPTKPEIFYPTSYGIPIILFKDKADLSGTAEPGSTVSLFRNGTLAASMTALASDRMESFNFNIELWGSVSPDGKMFALEGDPSLYLQTLATGDRKQIAEGYCYYPQWSPNGEKLSYISYDDTSSQTRIGIYDVVKGSNIPFSGGTETSNEYDSSWSFDGNKIAYLSDRGGTSDAWLLDLSSGLITQVTSGLNLNTLRFSPDGRRLAYSVEPNLYVTDLVNGTTTQADTNAEPWTFEWAPDSRMLVFASYRNGNADIFVLDTETQAQTQVTNSADDELYPSWSPDGRNVVYQKINQSGSNSIEIASSQTPGQQRLLKENLSSLNYLSWLRSGKIAYSYQNNLNLISPQGTFSVENISLAPGENVFYATATDASGNISPTSDEISIIFNSALFPDLEITPDDIFIYPASPVVGEEAAVTVIYRNKSQIEVTGVDVNIYLWDSKGNVELLKTQTIGRLAPASEEWITLSLDTTGKTGSNRIIAVIDPEDKITEALEDNNDAIKEFFVAGQEGLFMTTTLDATQYQSKQDVNIMVNLKNSGAEKAVTLEVWVEDENGVTVASVNTIPADLPYASEKDYSVVWNTGLTFSGAYRVHTILKEGTIIRAENTVPFSILPDTNIQTTVVTDKAGYRPNENVVVTITVRNGGENAPISELKTITRILDAGGQELFKEEDAIKNLLPGGISSLNLTWNAGLHPVGDYNVSTETYLNNQLVASKSALFRIDTSIMTTGSIRVTPSIILVKNTGLAEYVLKNEGNVDMNGVLVRLLVVDPEAQVTLATQEETIDLGIGASRNGAWSISTVGYSLKTYVLILQSVYQGDTKPIANASFSVKGGTPHVSVSPQSLDFGNINLGSAFTQTIALSNTGNADLVIGTIALSGTNQGEFSIPNDNCSGRPIAPSGSCTLDVLFSPTSLGVKSASLFIPSNATEMPTLYLPLGGKGITNLNVSINPAGSGRVTGTGIDCPGGCTESFSASGASIQLTAVPMEGYQFTNWTGDINSPENPLTVNMDTNKNVTANFVISTFTIAATAGLGSVNK